MSPNVCAPNNKECEDELIELEGEIDKSTVMVGVFNHTVSVHPWLSNE